MPATIKVSRVGGTSEDSLPTVTYTTLETDTIPSEIFVHQVDDRGVEFDKYVSIATLKDLEQIPSSRLAVGKGNYYRKSTALVKFSSFPAAVRGNDEIEFAIKDLLEVYNQSTSILTLNDTLEV